MKLLAKQYGSDLIAVAYNVSKTDMVILDTLIKRESLIALDSASDSNGLMHQPAKVMQRIGGPMVGVFPATLHSINATDEQVAIMIVANGVRYAVNAVNVHRANFDKNLVDQQAVYSEKAVQAKRVVEGETSNIGYVELEAEVKGLSVSDAALSILEAAEKHEAMLFKTESIRIRYTKAAYELKTHADLAEFKSRLSAELTG